MQTMAAIEFMDLNPGTDYSEDRIASLWAGRSAITPADVVTLDMVPRDRVWLLLHWNGITPSQRVQFVADCADRALPLFEAKFPRDARLRKDIEAAADGSAFTAFRASVSAASAVARIAEADDFGVEECPAATAARKAEQAWQVTRLVEILK